MRKKRKSKFLAIIISLAVALVMLRMMTGKTYAAETIIDGIYYELDEVNKTATVIDVDNMFPFNEELSIPSTVKSSDKTYTVSKINGVKSLWFKKITIPTSITSIGDGAFSSQDIETFTVPEGVTSIGENAFEFCWDLNTVTILGNITSIEPGTFYDCEKLKNITIPASVKSIGLRAFMGCESLETITIPKGVTTIDDMAFGYCENLKKVVLPASITSMSDPFYGCRNLETINFCCGTKNQWDDFYFYYLPDDVEVIFSGWNKDPDNITWIEDDTKKPGDKDYFKQSSVAKWTCTNGDSHVWESEALSMQVKSYQEPSCTQEGKCVYEAIFEAPDGENYLALKEVPISATGHVLTKTEKVEPTCTESGYEEYWTCSTCKKMFSDKDGEHEITEPVVIDATGHKWGEWNVTKEATYDKEGEETRICEHDATHTETRSIDKLDPVNADITYKNTKGDGSSWTKKSEEVLEFAFERSENDKQTYERFKGILVDNEEVPEENEDGTVNYEKEAGSVIIKLQPEYLETLALGKHTLTAQFDDGSVTADFTVLAAEDKKDDEEPEKDITDDKTTSKNKKTNNDSGNDLTKKNKTSLGDKNKTAGTTQAVETGDKNGFLNWLMVFAASAGILISGWVMYKGRRKHIRKY